MKKNIILGLFASVLFATACDYNKDNFGLDGNVVPTDLKKIEYTLTDADYKAIASNSKNKAIAKAAEESGEAGVVSALTAVQSKLCLSDLVPAKTYLPAFLATKWVGSDAGSSVRVTYSKMGATPAYLTQIQAANNYKLKNDDYSVAWSDKAVYNFTPSKPATTYLPRILKKALPDAQEGDYVTVEYNYSASEPSTGEEVESYDKISDAVEGPVGEYNVKGYVAAAYGRGFLLTDGKASVLVYLNKMSNYSLGDVVSVKGTTSLFAGLKQFLATSEVTKISVGESFAYPVFTEMNASALDAYLTAPVVKSVTYTGKLAISGNYYNVTIEGAGTAIGSLSSPVNGMIDASLNGQNVTVTGFAIGVSSGKYVNTMVVKVVAAGETSDIRSIGEVVLADPGTYHIRGIVTATSARGFLVNDGTGSILVYLNKIPEYAVNDVVTVSGTTAKYSGLKQFSASAVIEKVGTTTYSYPNQFNMTSADMDAYLVAPYAAYVSYKGKLAISGSFYNVTIDGANTAIGSLSYPNPDQISADLNDKEVIVSGYAIGVSSGKYVNTMVLSVKEPTPAALRSFFTTRAVTAEKKYAVYQMKNGTWIAGTNMAMVNPSDYRQMGINNDSFSSSFAPDNYVAQFMKLTYPYAQEGDVKAAVYFYNTGSATTVLADEYVFTHGAWAKDTYKEVVTDQFVYNGEKWNYDPSTVISLPPVKTNEMTIQYMQAATDWVWENIDKKLLGLTDADKKAGLGYMTSFANNEYYSGCSAYYGNVDMRPEKAKAQYAKGYEGMSDEQVYKTMCEHLIEVMQGVLEKKNSEAKPVEGIEVIYTVQVGIYTGAQVSVCTHQMQYKVVGEGKFEYVENSFQPLK